MWFVAVRAIIDKVEEAEGAKHIGRIPRGHTPEPHQIDDRGGDIVGGIICGELSSIAENTGN